MRMYEDDPKKRALIEAEKMLDPCPLCGKRENVNIDFDIVGMTTIKCSCGLTVGPIFGMYKCVERYNNRAGENRIMQDLWEYQDKAEYYEDLVKRLNGDSAAADPEQPADWTRIDALLDDILPF